MPQKPPSPPATSPYAAQPNIHPYNMKHSDVQHFDVRVASTAPLRNNYSPTPQTASQQNAYPQTSNQSTEVKVGLLLPLTGANSKLGQNMLDAAMLGLSDKYALSNNNTRIMLLPKNTGDTPKNAIKAANDAIKDGAKLLLGPLDAASTNSIKPIASKAGIDIISFSNNITVADDKTFIMGFMMQEQITQIIAHISKQNKQHLAILLPSNNSSDALETLLRQAIATSGINETSIVKYGAGTNDFNLVIGQLNNNVASKMQAGLPPADAVLILEGGERAAQLIATLRAQPTSTQYSYYGIGLLDNQALLGKPELIGVEFASSSARNFQQFARRFEHEYGYSPSRISSLGYDAISIAADILATAPSPNSNIIHSSITRSNGFVTPANGLIRFNANGSNQRSLAIMRIENGKMNEISPAKRIFE